MLLIIIISIQLNGLNNLVGFSAIVVWRGCRVRNYFGQKEIDLDSENKNLVLQLI